MTAIVTTAYRFTPETIAEAKKIASELGLRYVERRKKSIRKLHEEIGAAVVAVTKERLEFYPQGKTEPFFFHPSSSAFRTRRPLAEDPLVSVSGLAEGDTFIDCTLGMASDAIVASAAVGSQGSVTGCEAHPVIAYLVQRGLQEYTELPHLVEPMRRISVVSGHAINHLSSLPDESADVVYMDPMFTEEITGAANFEVFRGSAVPDQLDAYWVKEALRVARKSVVLKAHFRSEDFERYGFERRVRPNTKFHYGVIRK